MKTKIYLLLIVLFSISLKAQIPTLAERSFSILKKNPKENNAINLNEIILNEIELLEEENKNFEQKNTDTKLHLLDEGFTGNQNEKIEEIIANVNQINENKKKIKELNTYQDLFKDSNLGNANQYSNIYMRIYAKKINAIKETIRTKEENISKLDNVQEVDEEILEIKSLRKQIKELQYEFKTKNENYNWLPSIKSRYSKAFYKIMYNTNENETSYLNSFAINYNDFNTVAQSEIIADTFGSLRVSFGTVLQANTETPETEEEKEEQSEQNQLDQLINGGGNFYLEALYPVYFNTGNICTLYGFLNNKYAFTVDGLNQYIDSEAFNGSLGANIYFGLNSYEKKFNFFIKSDANLVVGTNTLYQNLQLADEKPFFQGKVIVGLTFLSKFRLAATINSFGSDEALRRNKVTFGLQIIP